MTTLSYESIRGSTARLVVYIRLAVLRSVLVAIKLINAILLVASETTGDIKGEAMYEIKTPKAIPILQFCASIPLGFMKVLKEEYK